MTRRRDHVLYSTSPALHTIIVERPARSKPSKPLPATKIPAIHPSHSLKRRFSQMNSAENTPRTLFLHANRPGYRNRPCHSPGSTPPKIPDIPLMLMLLCQTGAPQDTRVQKSEHTRDTVRPTVGPAKSRQRPVWHGPLRALVCLHHGIRRIQVAKRGGRLATPARPGRNQDKEKTHKE